VNPARFDSFISYQPPEVNEANAVATGWQVTPSIPIDRIARGILTCSWSPIVWKGGVRLSKNFERASWLALDFDGELPLMEALDIWQDSIHIIGTTKSHGIKGDRFRVLLKLAEVCRNGADYAHTVDTMIQTYGGDRSTTDAARFFFPCREIISTLDEGYTQDILAAPPPVVYPKRERNTRIIPAHTLKKLRFQVIPEGQRNDFCFGAAKDLAWAGYSIDETMGLILESPTYKTNGSPPVREILQAVRSGFKSAAKEAASGQEEEATE
jgi:hypothetical protein